MGRRLDNAASRGLRGAFSGLAAGALLLGLGASAAAQEIKLSPSSIQFGRVTDAKTRAVKIQNKGDADLLVGPVERCDGTSDEFTFALGGTLVPARRSADLSVTYRPTDEGGDDGCLEIQSNDPDDPVVELRLAGAGARPAGGGLRLRPDALEFGRVEIGTAATRTFQVQTTGGSSVDVAVVLCAGTSVEYAVSPDRVTVSPGRGATVEVAYEPMNAGGDAGCVDLQPADGQPPLALRLAGTGVEQGAAPAEVDLDIHDFKVRKELRLATPQQIQIRLWVKNAGSIDEPAPAIVVGSQNGVTVYENTLAVSDRPGNEGVSKYTFPAFTPDQEGDVVWTVTIEDADEDEDTATAVTRVLGETSQTTGVDLDIRRFRASGLLSLSGAKPVRLRLAVQNNGDLDEPREATLVGMRGEDEVFSETFPVSDPPGNRGATNYRFSDFVPAAIGEIVWMVVIDDDDSDLDEAFAVTRVTP